MTDTKPTSTTDELSNLRARVNQLSDPVAPALANATDQVKRQAQQAKTAVSGETEKVAQLIREFPAAAVLIGCLAGYMVGRIVR